jgi:hypothetical protein
MIGATWEAGARWLENRKRDGLVCAESHRLGEEDMVDNAEEHGKEDARSLQKEEEESCSGFEGPSRWQTRRRARLGQCGLRHGRC